MYLLIVILLQWGSQGPPRIQEVEVKEIFSTEENCGKRIQEIYKEAKERKTVIPPQFNIGCVPLNKVTT
jgi:hypothetical protein|tara:strand:- start:167 stop:373 length:207 start_codon:yes stop_codon:yes gene_type:complete